MSAYRKSVVPDEGPSRAERWAAIAMWWREVEMPTWLKWFACTHAIAVWFAWLLRLGDVWGTGLSTPQFMARALALGLVLFFTCIPGWTQR